MLTVELLFAGIVRFSLIAFVLLGVCWCIVRLMKQPLERIRLIQISLVTVLFALGLCVADVGPTVDLAWLPAPESPETSVTEAEAAAPMVVAGRPLAAEPNDSLLATDAHAQTAGDEAAGTATDPRRNVSASITTRFPATNRFDWRGWLQAVFTGVFLVISLFHFVYLAVGLIATRRLIQNAQPLSDAALDRVARMIRNFPRQSHVTFVSSDRIDVPMVVGLRRPTILLPTRLTLPDADPLELKHSLAHEWGHVELHDLMTWQLASACQTFLWIQPCYWALCRELRVAQDQLADQFAIQQTNEHASYATTLLELASARQKALPGALTMAGGKSNLYRRIEMLMNERLPIVRVTRKSIVLSLGVLFIAAGSLLTCLQLTHASPNAASTPNDKLTQDAEAKSDGAEESAEHSGVVTDADTGKPIAGVTVTVTRMESRDWQELGVTESVTDENGRYTFQIPPEQLSQRLLYIMFDIDHPDYAQRHCGSYGYGMIVKNLENGEQPWFSKLQMVRGEKIVGRLVDENQNPIAGVQIRCNCAPKSGYDRVRSSWIEKVSDEDGRFELMATFDGTTKLSFIPPDHCMKHINLGDKRGDIGDITLTSGFPIHGVVKDAEGNPMSGLWVNITPEEERRDASYEMKRSAETDEDGRFRTRPIKPGKYLFEVERKATGALEKTEVCQLS